MLAPRLIHANPRCLPRDCSGRGVQVSVHAIDVENDRLRVGFLDQRQASAPAACAFATLIGAAGAGRDICSEISGVTRISPEWR